MKSLGFICGLVMMISSAQAMTYRCEVKDYDDYAVEISVKAGKAAFFDNNSWDYIPEVVGGAPMGVSKFEGLDQYGDLLTVLFDFREGLAPQHSVSFVEDERRVTVPMDCYYTPEKDLYSDL